MRPEALLLLLWSGPALAWNLNGAQWSWQGAPVEDPVHVSPATFRPEEASEEEITAAVDRAMESWNTSGYDVAWSRGEPVVDPTQAADTALQLFHGAAEDWGTTLAYASVWGTDDGLAYDCDVLFLDADDDGDIVWSADPAGAPDGAWDVEAVALHELGHCLGLSHSDDPTAVMYAHYSGERALQADDLAGLAALYAPVCPDQDGDGVSSCAGDCADDNALVSPATLELCNGVDDNCNGITDEREGQTLTLGAETNDADWSGLSVGNGVRVDAATTLRSLRQRWEGPAGARRVWSISRRVGGAWELVTEARGEAVAGAWQESPALDLPLAAGETYAVVLGTLSDGVTMYYQKRPSLDAQGPLTPLGSLSGRALGDQLSTADDRYLVAQEWVVTDAAGTGCEGDSGAGDSGGPDSGVDSGGLDSDGSDSAVDSAADSATDTGGAKPVVACACASGGGGAGAWGLVALALGLTRRRQVGGG